MKKLNELQSYLTRLRGLMLTLVILLTIGSGNVWGGTVVNQVANITSGSQYRIKHFNNSYYLTVPATSGTIGGYTSTENDGTVFTFTKESTNWYVTFVKSGTTYYMTTSTSKGVISFTTDKTAIIVQDLTIGDGHYIDIGQSGQGTNDWHIRFNTGSSRCGFYKNSSNMARTVLSTAGASTYTVTYDGNEKTSGSVPTDATAYNSGATVTVKGNTGNLARTGYSFGGWNTKADGSGTNYTAGSGTFTITANTTLYAKWNPNQYTVTWVVNGSTVRTDSNVNHGSSVTPPTVNPLPCGDKLAGWTDAAGGNYTHNTSTLYSGATIQITSDVTLYAVFADYEN